MNKVTLNSNAMEAHIAELMRSGDRSFLDLLYEEYGGIMYKISMGIVKSRELAEDVLQDSLVKIWKNAERFDKSKAKLLTWVIQIVKNTALDYVKSKATKYAAVTESIDHQPSAGSAYGVSSQDEDFIGLREVIDKKLEKRDKQIVDMLYFEGYTQKEVAEKLSMPLGSVKTRVRLTVDQLRTYLKN